MKRWISAGCTAGAALAIVLTASSARADTWNKKTIITTSGQLEVPGGVVLNPGKYVLKLADSASNRHIVQVFNEDENQIFATVLAIPNYRQQPTDKTVITTWETPAGQPPAIRSWFYPGDNFGQEFAYPKHRATEISRAAGEPVPTSESAEDTSRTEIARAEEPLVDEYPESPSPYVDEEAAAQTPEPARSSEEQAEEPELMAQNQPAPEPQQTPSAQQPSDAAPQELPQTASPAELIGLLGLGSLGVAGALGAITRRRR